MDLRSYLLPRIRGRVQDRNGSSDSGEGSPLCMLDTSAEQRALNSILIKDNRIYAHKVARFYHTTYDVRRSEDVINPRTSHCNIMLLASSDANDGVAPVDTNGPFLYARVIGIYHANVVYTGPGMDGYEPMRFEFLWVRWLQASPDPPRCYWESGHLEKLEFPPMASKDAFGFVDPALVLRGCHLIPAFSQGKQHSDGVGLSSIAKDGQEWKQYYVNRYERWPLAIN